MNHNHIAVGMAPILYVNPFLQSSYPDFVLKKTKKSIHSFVNTGNDCFMILDLPALEIAADIFCKCF
jgi:hypothetical protein